jgi:hypothetical protein
MSIPRPHEVIEGKKLKNIFDPDVFRTRSLLIWSQTRYRCATESHLRCNYLFNKDLNQRIDQFH